MPASGHQPEKTTLSLLQLEERSRGLHGKQVAWRAGAKMRGEVLKRKTLLYAIQRRMRSAVAVSPADRLQSALSELEIVRREVSARLAAGKAQNSSRAQLCSLHQLVDHLKMHEMKPAEYEQTVLLWPQLATMPRGNPRARMQVSFSYVQVGSYQWSLLGQGCILAN